MHLVTIAIATVLVVASTLVTSAIAVACLVLMPPDYFVRTSAPSGVHAVPRAARLALRVAKNAVGALLVVLGVVMSLPGVPGPGVLTVLVGIGLCDVPGKRRLELRLITRPRVRAAVDGLRARFGRARLVLEIDGGAAPVPPVPAAVRDERV